MKRVILYLFLCGVGVSAQDQRGFMASRDELRTTLGAVRYYALLIAVEEYNDPSVNKLDEPVKDAERLRAVLVQSYGFVPTNVRMLINPTRTEIITSFDALAQSLAESDNLIIFYAGHGYYDEKLRQGFWLPRDAQKGSRSAWIPNSTIRDYIGGLSTKHTLLISDACFSGAIFKTRSVFADAPADVRELYQLPSRKAMTSGAMKTVPDKSVFMEYLIKRLSENNEQFLTSQVLFASMRSAVINNSPTNQTPQYGTIQETGDEGGDFIFYRPGSAKRAASLVVASSQMGSDVSIDGKPVGTANPTLTYRNIPPGKHSIEVRRDGFELFSADVNVAEEGETRVDALLEQLKAADVRIESSIPGASVYMDDALVGSASPTLIIPRVPWGMHTIKVAREGYSSFTQSIDVHAYAPVRITASLTVAPATLSTKGSVKADFYLNDVRIGTAPADGVEVQPGEYEISFRRKGYEEVEKEISIVGGKSYSIPYTLVKKDESKAIWKSALFPGLGQFYQDRDGMGYLFGVSFAAAMAGLAIIQFDVASKTSDYNAAYDAYTMSTNLSELPALRANLNSADAKLRDAETVRTYASIGAGAVYVLSLIDVLISTPDWGGEQGALSVSAHVGGPDRGTHVTASLHF